MKLDAGGLMGTEQLPLHTRATEPVILGIFTDQGSHILLKSQENNTASWSRHKSARIATSS